MLSPVREKISMKISFNLIQLIGSMCPNFDVWPNRRSLLNLGRPKLEFGSSHEQLDVWPRPNNQKDGLLLLSIVTGLYNVGSCYMKNKVSKKVRLTWSTWLFHSIAWKKQLQKKKKEKKEWVRNEENKPNHLVGR